MVFKSSIRCWSAKSWGSPIDSRKDFLFAFDDQVVRVGWQVAELLLLSRRPSHLEAIDDASPGNAKIDDRFVAAQQAVTADYPGRPRFAAGASKWLVIKSGLPSRLKSSVAIVRPNVGRDQ